MRHEIGSIWILDAPESSNWHNKRVKIIHYQEFAICLYVVTTVNGEILSCHNTYGARPEQLRPLMKLDKILE